MLGVLLRYNKQSLEQVPAEKIAALQQRHSKAINAALQTRCAQQLQLTERGLLRLLCALHWNGYVCARDA